MVWGGAHFLQNRMLLHHMIVILLDIEGFHYLVYCVVLACGRAGLRASTGEKVGEPLF